MCYTPLSARTAGGGGGTYFEDFPLRGVGARRVEVLVEVHGEEEGARSVAAVGHPLATETAVEAEGSTHPTDQGVVGESTCGGAEQSLKSRAVSLHLAQEMETHLQDVRNGFVKLCEHDTHLVEV